MSDQLTRMVTGGRFGGRAETRLLAIATFGRFVHWWQMFKDFIIPISVYPFFEGAGEIMMRLWSGLRTTIQGED